jgi:serine phosphatase RsbU (regulator of sigma subunit)
MYKTLILLIIFFNNLNLSGQNQNYNLSRQDSAKINNLTQKAVDYHANNFLKQECDCYNEIATVWWEHNYFTEAIDYYNKSLKINELLANENAIAMINSNLALIFADKGEYQKSLTYFEKTLNIRTIKNEKIGIIAARINISVVLNNLKRYDESTDQLLKALDLARELNDPIQMRSCYGMLSETYEKSGNNTKSYYYFELYRQFNELVEGKKVEKANTFANQERLKKELAEKENAIKELELIKKNYELITKEKKLKAGESEKLSLLDTLSHKELKIKFIENEAQLQQAKSEKELLKNKFLLRNIILFSSIILLVLFILIFFYFQKRKSNRILQNKNAEIIQKNEEIEVQKNNIEDLLIKTTEAHESITKSIDYAGYIQNALLNKTPRLDSWFPESFILYQPKGAVGGDFYWYSKVEEQIIVAAVDCTGHGVPGAFLTVLANNVLNLIVNIGKNTVPGEILKKMHFAVKEALNQEITENKDGMDIALCTVNLITKQLSFAGANNPMLIIKNGKPEIVKGERYGIGGFSEMFFERLKKTKNIEEMYQTHNIEIEPDMSIYLFSDGYQDQNGAETLKKLKSDNFHKLIHSFSTKPMTEQKKLLSDYFKIWKGGNEQIDDVVIIGLRFS